MNAIKSTLAIAAVAVAVSAPISTASASEGPFESNGKNVFELKREKQAQKLTDKYGKQGTHQVTTKTKKPNWFQRVFKTTKNSTS